MRIRKHVRRVNVGFPTGSSQVFGVWKLGWDRDCEQLSQRTAVEEPWMDFLTVSKQSGINSIVNDHGHLGEDEHDTTFFSTQCTKPESVSENYSRVGDLNLLKEQVNMLSEEGTEHVTRHYVRRKRDGDSVIAVPLQSECANVDLNATWQTVGKSNRNMYALKHSCAEFHDDLQLQGNLKTDLSMANNTTCTISKGGSFQDEEIIRDHPSREPEGSLLHALYLQLLAAGKEGLTVRELFASFKTQTSLPSLAMDWKDRVRAHLKTNPYFSEVKGRYLLYKKIIQLNATISGCTTICFKSSVTRDVQPFVSVGIPTALHFSCDSNDVHEAIQTSRKANKNTIDETLSEVAMETQKIQQDAETKVLLTVTDFRAFKSVTTSPIEQKATIQSTQIPFFERSRRKRKSSIRNKEDIFQSIKNGRATPGALIALQAKIVAKLGVQTGARCSRKDDRRNWQCPLMAKEGHTLCEHHIFLKEKKKVQHAKDATINKSKKMSKKLQEMTHLISLGHVSKSPTFEQEDIVADHVVEALVTLKSHVPTDATCQYLTQAIASHRHAGEETVKYNEPKRTSEKLLRHHITSAPKRRHIATKKTVVNGLHVKDRSSQELQNGQSTQPPAISPLPMEYGFRRKTIKNKSLLSF